MLNPQNTQRKEHDTQEDTEFADMRSYAEVGKTLLAADQFDFDEAEEFVNKEHPRAARNEIENVDEFEDVEEIVASTGNTPSTSAKESNENDIQMKTDKRAVEFAEGSEQ
jgi:hypothetical protein